MPESDFDDNGFIDPVDLEMVMDTMLSLADEDDAERLSQEERICIIQKVAPDRHICTANEHPRLAGDDRGRPFHHRGGPTEAWIPKCGSDIISRIRENHAARA